MKNITLVEINKLKSHERISKKRVLKIKEDILKRNFINNPVVVDRKTLIILDGHHRVNALKLIGARQVPVFFVNYCDKNIQVTLRRKKLMSKIIKQTVINIVKQKKCFPIKTTNHSIQLRPKNINININQLF